MAANTIKKDSPKKLPVELKKRVDQILLEEEKERKAHLLALKQQIKSGKYNVSSEGIAHALLSYIDEASKK